MPINKSMMTGMEKTYGKKKGQQVYFASEAAGKPSFKKALKTASKEGHTAKDLAAMKKGKKSATPGPLGKAVKKATKKKKA